MSGLLLLGLLGCHAQATDTASPEDSAAPTVVPEAGTWSVSFDTVFGGDCALDDPNTYFAAAESWGVDPRNGYVVFTLDYETWFGCTLSDAGSFHCAIADDVIAGSTATVEFATTMDGVFYTPDEMSATYAITATCTGDACDEAGGYGMGFTYPCAATAAVAGSWESP